VGGKALGGMNLTFLKVFYGLVWALLLVTVLTCGWAVLPDGTLIGSSLLFILDVRERCVFIGFTSLMALYMSLMFLCMFLCTGRWNE
jgi:hypothetical protein